MLQGPRTEVAYSIVERLDLHWTRRGGSLMLNRHHYLATKDDISRLDCSAVE